MENKIALLIPIRNRLDLLNKMIKSWEETTTGKSDIIFGIDDDDKTYDEFMVNHKNFTYEIGSPTTSLGWLNRLAKKYCKQYSYLGFFEDDCTFITKNWEKEYISELSKHNIAIVYNDLNDNMRLLCGLPFVTSSFVETLGFMCPENLEYLWADNFWYDIGNASNIIHRLDTQHFSHNHYSRCSDTPFDDIANKIYSKMESDRFEYYKYCKTKMKLDILKLIDENNVRKGGSK